MVRVDVSTGEIVLKDGCARIDLRIKQEEDKRKNFIKSPTPKEVSKSILSGELRTCASKRAMSATRIGSYIASVQRGLGLRTGSKRGEWTDEAQKRLELWLRQGKRRRKGSMSEERRSHRYTASGSCSSAGSDRASSSAAQRMNNDAAGLAAELDLQRMSREDLLQDAIAYAVEAGKEGDPRLAHIVRVLTRLEELL